MALKKGFLKPQFQDITIPKINKVIGIVYAIVTTLVIYLLFFISQEVFRFLLMGERWYINADYWLISGKQQYWYNFTWAFIALIFGQSVFIQFCFWRPKQKRQKNTYRYSAILLDSRVLLWVIFMVLVRFAHLEVMGEELDIDLLVNYQYILFLIPIPLYWHQWITIFRTYQNSFPFALKGFLLTILLAFGLAFWHPLDTIDTKLLALQNAPFYPYHSDIQEVNVWDRAIRKSIAIYFTLANPHFENYTPTERNIYNPLERGYQDMEKYIQRNLDDIAPNEHPFARALVMVGGNVPMKEFYQFKRELQKNKINGLGYTVKPKEKSSIQIYTYFHQIKKEKLQPYCESLQTKRQVINSSNKIENIPCVEDALFDILSSDHKINIHLDSNQILLNGNVVDTAQLHQQLLSIIRKNKDYAILIDCDENVFFKDYVHLNDVVDLVYQEVRNKAIQQKFGTNYQSISYDSKEIIRRQYPKRVFQLLPEEMVYVKN